MLHLGISSYSPQFKGISPWKQEKLRKKAEEAQEEYIRKHSYSRDKLNVSSKSYYYYDRKPQHPDPCSPGWEDDLRSCRKYANSLKRPDPSLPDFYDRLADWNEYSKYRTK